MDQLRSIGLNELHRNSAAVIPPVMLQQLGELAAALVKLVHNFFNVQLVEMVHSYFLYATHFSGLVGVFSEPRWLLECFSNDVAHLPRQDLVTQHVEFCIFS